MERTLFLKNPGLCLYLILLKCGWVDNVEVKEASLAHGICS